MNNESQRASQLPAIRSWQLRLFTRYASFYLTRHFHKVYLLRAAPLPSLEGWPVLVCMNHPSWWDPVIALHLSRTLFQNRRQYAPIALKGVQKYRFFERLGFFSIDPHSRSGASRFLRIGREVLKQPDAVFWVTAQGHFSDVRRRPVVLQAGIGHLARMSERFVILPIAFEYAFWSERSPEAFVCIGDPLFIGRGAERSRSEWLALCTSALNTAQDRLAEAVIARNPERFESLLKGVAGVGGVYDVWRSAKALLSGRRFHAEHEDVN